jgi:HEAT repeat protein
MKALLVLIGILLFASAPPAVRCVHDPMASSAQSAHDERQHWENRRQRYLKEFGGEIAGGLWSLIHTAERDSKKEVDESLELTKSLATLIARTDPRALGPLKLVEKKFLELTKSTDDAVSAFAATIIGISGDFSYAPQLASLLERKEKSLNDDDYHSPLTIRGRAAIALSLMGAKEYAPRIAPLLQSKNDYDRSGAAIALGRFGAKEYAKDVVALLLNEEFNVHDDDSPIFSLIAMGVGEEYKTEIAQALNAEFRSDTAKTAAYALAHLKAKDLAGEVAKLLAREYVNGDAAKALAIMGAKEFAGQIALLLTHEDSFQRQDASLALGILGAKEYAPQIARLLLDKKSWVQHSAAVSLILMEVKDYAPQAVSTLRRVHKSGPYLNGEFHPLVNEEALALEKRFQMSLAHMKSLTVSRPRKRR